MSWGDVWVNGDKVRPGIDADGPRAPWIPAGVISSEERAFVEATQSLRRTRGAHARAVEFDLQITSSAVGRERSVTGKPVVGFEPDGLWLAVDVTPAGSLAEEARFVVFAQRVHVVAGARRAAVRGAKGGPRATITLRGRARSRESALEWGYRAGQD
ncbi:hypothetical protein [Nocardioides sp.]|uniref:hypothetical protein n=1 Tax=Nocardioides sp. TaxID=35761 RepID=UPI002B273335|nr:hypothetical protein [Nocardioides sp.]